MAVRALRTISFRRSVVASWLVLGVVAAMMVGPAHSAGAAASTPSPTNPMVILPAVDTCAPASAPSQINNAAGGPIDLQSTTLFDNGMNLEDRFYLRVGSPSGPDALPDLYPIGYISSGLQAAGPHWIQIPQGVLFTGTTYAWYSTAYDGTTASPGSTSCYFTVTDGRAPDNALPQTCAGQRRDVFSIGQDSLAYQRVWTGTTWTQWASQGAPPVGLMGRLGVVQAGARYDIFGVGKDGQAYQKVWTGSAWIGWSAQGSPPGGLAGDLQVTQGGGRYDVFGTGVDGQVYQQAWTGSAWTAWVSPGVPAGGPLTAGIAVVRAGSRYDIFGLSVDGNVYQKVWTGWCGQPGPRWVEPGSGRCP